MLHLNLIALGWSLAVILLQYWPGRYLVVRYAPAIAERLPLSFHKPVMDVAMAVGVALAGLTGTIIALIITWLSGKAILDLFTQSFTWTLIPFGVLLGLGEAAVALLLSSLVLFLCLPLRARQVGGDIAYELRMLSQVGWMRAYRKTLQILPGSAAWAVIAIGLLSEELIFRGVVVRVFAFDGLVVAMLASTLPFIAVQSLGMPSWFSSLPATCGAAVMGAIHALLFLAIPNLTPLLIAHLTFFAVMIL